MELATFDSVDELMKYFRVVSDYVGPRKGPNKRTKDRKEFYNLRQYLPTLAANGRLQFPLTIEKGESPDFLLSNDGSSAWGLEVTEATTQKYQRELTMTEGKQNSPHLLSDSGWTADSAGREVCAAILRAMRRKAKKIREGKYRPASRYDVLIFISVGACYADDDIVSPLKRCVSRWYPQWAGLSRVEIIAKSHLYSVKTNNLTRMPLFNFESEQ